MSDQPHPQIVPASPVPMTWNVIPCLVVDKGAVQLTVYTPQGLTVLFLEPDQAKHIGIMLERAASSARTGLVLPPSAGAVP